MNRNQRRCIVKNYILGRDAEPCITDNIEEINRLSLFGGTDDEFEEKVAPDVPTDDNN